MRLDCYVTESSSIGYTLTIYKLRSAYVFEAVLHMYICSCVYIYIEERSREEHTSSIAKRENWHTKNML